MRFAGCLLAAALMSATEALGQSAASGVVRRPSEGGPVGVGGVRLVLHKVGRATQGPIDSTHSDRAGRFAFRFPTDTAANYLISARYAGIEYFSQPLATNPARPDTGITLWVYDTSSVGSLRTKSRTLVVGGPDAVGARTVIDWIVISNRGVTTRVGADSTAPTFAALLAAGARNPQVGDPRVSQISPEAVSFRGDSVLVTAPLAPGDKELLLQYELPPRPARLVLPLPSTDSADVFLEEITVAPPASGWAVSDSQAFEGRKFRRLTRTASSVDRLDLELPGGGLPPERFLPWLVGLVAVGLGALGWVLVTRPSPLPIAGPDPIPLADEVARLDLTLAAATGDHEALLRRREALMTELRAALAGRRSPS